MLVVLGAAAAVVVSVFDVDDVAVAESVEVAAVVDSVAVAIVDVSVVVVSIGVAVLSVDVAAGAGGAATGFLAFINPLKKEIHFILEKESIRS